MSTKTKTLKIYKSRKLAISGRTPSKKKSKLKYSLAALLKCFKIVNNANRRFYLKTWHLFSNILKSLFNSCRRV